MIGTKEQTTTESGRVKMNFLKRHFLQRDEYEFIESWIKFIDKLYLYDSLKICKRFSAHSASLELWCEGDEGGGGDVIIGTIEDVGLDHFIVLEPDEKYLVKDLIRKTIGYVGRQEEENE